MDAVDAARDASLDRTGADPKLLKLVVEAEATGFRPWEDGEAEEQPSVLPMRRRRFVTVRAWLLAAAACVPLAVGIGLWRYGATGSFQDWENGLNLRVWYYDLESTDRGIGTLTRGTRPNVYVTVPSPAYATLLVLNGGLGLRAEDANVRLGRNRNAVPWKLDRPGTETLIVVISKQPWDDAAQVADSLNRKLSGPREQRVEQIIDAVHGRGFAVGHKTYTVE